MQRCEGANTGTQELHDIFGIAFGKIVMDAGNALSGLLDVGGTSSKIQKRPVELPGILGSRLLWLD
jgi:hypothetical protein